MVEVKHKPDIKNKDTPARYRLVMIISVLLMFGAACSLSNSLIDQGEETGSSVETSIAETIAAQKDTTPTTGENEPSPSETIPPEDTDTPTPSTTPTPGAVPIHVTGNTNCRTGPGSVYQQVGILNTDQQSKTVARDPTGNFWYIANPDNNTGHCWIWDKYATPQGNTSHLPVYTPPPSPTPGLNFSVAFYEMDACVGNWFEFTIVNNGGIPLESVSVTIKDTNSGKTFGPQPRNKFIHSYGCIEQYNQNSIKPGNKYIVSSPGVTTRSYDPSGKSFQAVIKICSQKNMSGDCRTRYLSFTAPLKADPDKP